MTDQKAASELKFIIRVPSVLRYVDIAYEFMLQVVRDTELDPERIDWISLAFREAVNNAVLHGNKKDPEKWVDVEISTREGWLYFKVYDEGPGFDQSILRDPRTQDNIFRPNGRGIFLIRQFVDNVRFLEDGGRFGIEIGIDLAKKVKKES